MLSLPHSIHIYQAIVGGGAGGYGILPYGVARRPEGVRVYADKLQSELQDAMQMCGVHTLKEITRDQILRP